jgi:hypothetical protein
METTRSSEINEHNYKVLMVGLPETGKTTFLAAFWYVVSNDGSKTLSLKELPETSDYLNSISTEWAKCQFLERNKVAASQIIKMRLEEPEGGETFEVVVPDLSGEIFSCFVKDRQASFEYAEYAKDAIGIILFIHPEKVVEPTLISEAEILIDEIKDAGGADEFDDNTAPWNIEKMPTEVQLVELLQFHIKSGLSNLMSRIIVLISAWDLVQNEVSSPVAWLKKRLPLLDQFLLSNNDRIGSKICGISAQGADYTAGMDKDKLLDLAEPTKRIIVVNDENNSGDITSLIRWLISD